RSKRDWSSDVCSPDLGWTRDNKVFNFEGGCYAKAIDLSAEKEPDIYNAVKPGAILENVVLKADGDVDFHDTSITQNTRVSYPIYHINNIQIPSVGENPKNRSEERRVGKERRE